MLLSDLFFLSSTRSLHEMSFPSGGGRISHYFDETAYIRGGRLAVGEDPYTKNKFNQVWQTLSEI